MGIDDADFRPAVVDGITLRRDSRVHNEVMRRAAAALSAQRELFDKTGKIADHLSDDIMCLRKSVLKRRRLEKIIAESGDPHEPLTADHIVMFGVGYGFQHALLGDVEEARWSEKYQLMYSPDGPNLEGIGFVEVKTSRRSPLKKDDRAAGMSVEDVLMRDRSEWWAYILGVMKLEGLTEYHLEHLWVVSGEAEGFTVEATKERIERNWGALSERRERRRAALRDGTLPGVDTRRGAWECGICPFGVVEPCMSDVLRYNLANPE